MAYQPPGPYPVMPMQPMYGPPQRPPIPEAALRAYYAILVGAALALVSLIISVSEVGSLRSQFRATYPQYSATRIDELLNIAIGFAVFGGIVQILLWLWMAWKIKTGRHWARVLCSVFFGITVVGQAVGNTSVYTRFGDSGDNGSIHTPHPAIAIVVGWAIVAVGLAALVLFWNKSTTPFFRPQQFFNPGGYPYPYPYPPQGYPAGQFPGQAGYAPQEGQPQPPADPWGTTPPE